MITRFYPAPEAVNPGRPGKFWFVVEKIRPIRIIFTICSTGIVPEKV